jgi:hypothetical protein
MQTAVVLLANAETDPAAAETFLRDAKAFQTLVDAAFFPPPP